MKHQRSSGPSSRTKTIAAVAFAIAAAGAIPATAAAPSPPMPDRITSSKTITFCSAMTQPPLEFLNEKQQPVGIDIDLGEAFASRLGLKVKWSNIPFAGLIPALLADHCDAILSQLFIKPPRLEVIDEIPYMYSQEGLIVKSDSPSVPTLADLSGKKVSTVTGTTATQLLEEANVELAKAGKPPINIIKFPEGTPALQQVQFGQVAAYGLAYEMALYYGKLTSGAFKVAGPPYYKILTGIGVAKTQPGIEAALKTQLDAMMKDGSYAALFKKWDLEDDKLPQ